MSPSAKTIHSTLTITSSVDLGSGVGNALVNVATQTSCATYGTEIMPNPARLGTLQIAEAKRRWHMWALRGTEQVRAYEADFCKHEKTGKALRVADLVVSSSKWLSFVMRKLMGCAARE